MPRRGWLGLGWGALCVLAAACESGDADSCGGPTSDFPYCGDNEGSGYPDDGVGGEAPVRAGDPVDLNGDGQSDGVAVDGDGDGNADGVDTNGDGAAEAPLPEPPDGGLCQAQLPVCTGAAAAVSASGTAVQAPVSIDHVALEYFDGDNPQAQLTFVGLAADEPIAIVAPFGAMAPAGSYEGTGVQLLRCADQAPLSSSLEILEHDPVGVAAPAGRLRGVLRVSETGWSLEIPFDIEQACAERKGPISG